MPDTISAASVKRTQRDDAIEYLRGIVPPGTVVHTVLRHVSRSGMTRHISLVVPYVREDGTASVRNITAAVARACGYTLASDHGLKVGGAGMDMGFAVVYHLGRVLWPEGPERFASPRNGDSETLPGGSNVDGGYSLDHSWL